jgi:hypothetical protein
MGFTRWAQPHESFAYGSSALIGDPAFDLASGHDELKVRVLGETNAEEGGLRIEEIGPRPGTGPGREEVSSVATCEQLFE